MVELTTNERVKRKKRGPRNTREIRFVNTNDEGVLLHLAEIIADFIYEDMKKTGRLPNEQISNERNC